MERRQHIAKDIRLSANGYSAEISSGDPGLSIGSQAMNRLAGRHVAHSVGWATARPGDQHEPRSDQGATCAIHAWLYPMPWRLVVNDGVVPFQSISINFFVLSNVGILYAVV